MSLIFAAKSAIKAAFRSVGLEVRRRQPHPLEFLASHGIRTVLDVGAHDGEFAGDVRAVLPDAVLHSFEPLAEPFRRLQARGRFDRRFHAWNLAVGDRQGSVQMHVNNSPSTSSLLPEGSLRQHFPHLALVEKQTVPMTTLDAWSQGIELPEQLLLKADVQGFEGHVLRGAAGLLARTSLLLLEVSFERLYEGQPLFEEIEALVAAHGYRLHGMIEPIADPRTHRQLQSNAVFCRDRAVALAKPDKVG